MTRPRELSVEICGVTRPADAELSSALGADMIGQNFCPRPAASTRLACERAEIVRGQTVIATSR